MTAKPNGVAHACRLIGHRPALQHACACHDCEPSRILRRSATWEGSMIFVYRAAIVAVATFVSALAGFGAHWVLPAAYVVESKGISVRSSASPRRFCRL